MWTTAWHGAVIINASYWESTEPIIKNLSLILVAAKNIILLVNVVILAPKKKVVLKGKFYYHIINLFIPLLNNKTKKILLRYTKKFWYHLLRVNELGRSEASISITRTNAILFSFSFSHDQHSILPCSLHTCECVRPAWCRLYFPVASLSWIHTYNNCTIHIISIAIQNPFHHKIHYKSHLCLH